MFRQQVKTSRFQSAHFTDLITTAHSLQSTELTLYRLPLQPAMLNVERHSTHCPHSITERRVPELIPVLGSQPAGHVSHKPDGRLQLLSARPAVTHATLKRLLPVSLLGEQRHDGCEQFAQDCYPTASRLRCKPRLFCA